MDIIYQSFRKRYYCARNVNGEVYIDIENNGGANNKSQKDFKALRGLPFGQKLRKTYNWKTIIASKADVGAGGRNHPKIVLHINLAKLLDLIKD